MFCYVFHVCLFLCPFFRCPPLPHTTFSSPFSSCFSSSSSHFSCLYWLSVICSVVFGIVLLFSSCCLLFSCYLFHCCYFSVWFHVFCISTLLFPSTFSWWSPFLSAVSDSPSGWISTFGPPAPPRATRNRVMASSSVKTKETIPPEGDSYR